MIVFSDEKIYTGGPITRFKIAEDNIYERQINLNADRGLAQASVREMKDALKRKIDLGEGGNLL